MAACMDVDCNAKGEDRALHIVLSLLCRAAAGDPPQPMAGIVLWPAHQEHCDAVHQVVDPNVCMICAVRRQVWTAEQNGLPVLDSRCAGHCQPLLPGRAPACEDSRGMPADGL